MTGVIQTRLIRSLALTTTAAAEACQWRCGRCTVRGLPGLAALRAGVHPTEEIGAEPTLVNGCSCPDTSTLPLPMAITRWSFHTPHVAA